MSDKTSEIYVRQGASKPQNAALSQNPIRATIHRRHGTLSFTLRRSPVCCFGESKDSFVKLTLCDSEESSFRFILFAARSWLCYRRLKDESSSHNLRADRPIDGRRPKGSCQVGSKPFDKICSLVRSRRISGLH
jgi:hypothetical protein